MKRMQHLCLGILLIWGVRAFGGTYFVAPVGNDSNVGSAAAPWRTIQKAANALVAGDVVRVQPGTYGETASAGTVTESTDGRADSPITYLADGAVVLRRFSISGDYVRVIGFEFTHPSDMQQEAILVVGATGVQIMDNYIHDTSRNGWSGGLSYGNCTNLLVRGNRFLRCGTVGAYGPDSNAKCIGERYGYNDSRNVLIDYNQMSHASEYINPAGLRHIIRNNVFGPTTTNDFGGIPHIDGVQPNGKWKYSFMEANWHVENPVNDSHLYLDENQANYYIALLRNVSIRSGDNLVVQWRDSTNRYAAHNVFAETACGPSRRLSSSHCFVVRNCTNNVSRNNIFKDTTTDSTPYGFTGTYYQLTHDHDQNNRSVAFVGYANRDLRPPPGAASVDTAAPLTTTVGGGSGTTITVVEPHWFHDGFGLTVGHRIYVGDDNGLTVTSVDYGAKSIKVSSSITWADGEAVGFAYRGSGPDIGAYELGDTLLTEATIAQTGDNYAVTPVGDARFVTFYRDGLPYTSDFTSPFTATVDSGKVTAKVFAMHPQSSPVIEARTASASAPRRNVHVGPSE